MKPAPFAVSLVGSLLFGSTLHAAPVIVAHGHGPVNLTLFADGATRRLEIGGRPRPVELPLRSRVESLESLGDGWLIAGTAPGDAGPELFFLKGDENSDQRLPGPPGPANGSRENAVPFVDRDRFVGAAWLEGPEERKYGVRFSAWLGDRFAAPEVVAPAGPGSQLALQGARLADGRLLLVWSGFDGKDDEIWYSLRTTRAGRDSWSAPARVADDNATPDIVPAVLPFGAGALVAWSRFDGSEYRLMTARLDGERWHDSVYAAPPGTLFPTFERGPSGPALLYRDARESDWELSELRADGTLGRSARLDDDSPVRPVVSFEGSSVLWSFGDRSAVSSWQ